MEKNFLKKLLKTNPKSLKLSLGNVHHKGVFSLVLKGAEFGNLTRCFIADKKIKPFSVQLHTHRYPVRITVLKGNVKHHLALRTSSEDSAMITLSEFEYNSFLNGGSGLKYLKESNFRIEEFTLPIGCSFNMTSDEFHTMSCSKDSIWIVEELGFDKETSLVLGVPFIAEHLYTKPEMFQINDKCQVLFKELRKLLNHYN